MRDILKFRVTDGIQRFTASGELFVNLDGFFSHQFVSFLGAPGQDKIWPGRNPFVPIGI